MRVAAMFHKSRERGPSEKDDADALTLRTAWLILVACMAVSLVVAAMAALNTALPDIAVATGADNAEMTWIIDGYTLILAALLLPAGALGDRFGRRDALLAGLAIFGIASLAAIWVDSPTELIATRFAAGVGAALIMPATLSLITSGVPRDKRALGVSAWAAVAGAGAILGFFVTGVLLAYFSWHAVFITFAASALATFLITFTIGSSKDENPGRFDVFGSASSILAVAGVVYGLLEAPHRGWTDPLILLTLIGGLLLGGAFVLIELRRRSPLLDVRLFSNRAFASGALAVALQFFASFGLFFLVLQQLQLIFGYSPLMSAVALFPMVVGVGIFAMLGNWLAVRFHSLRFVLAIGIALAGLGVLLIGLIDTDEYWRLGAMLGVCAIGIGLATAPSTTAIMSNTPLENQGVGSAVNDTARELGAAIGIALAGSIMAAGYGNRISATADLAERSIGTLDPARSTIAGDAVRGSLAGATEVAEQIRPQAPQLADTILAGARDAFLPPMQHACILLAAILFAGAAVIGWFAPRQVIPPHPTAEAPERTPR